MTVALILCFLPIVIIFVGIKLILLFEETYKEYDYVRREPTRKRGPYLENVYEDTESAEDEDRY